MISGGMASAQILGSKCPTLSPCRSRRSVVRRSARQPAAFVDRRCQHVRCAASAGADELPAGLDRRLMLLALATAAAAGPFASRAVLAEQFAVTRSEEEWRALLTPAQYRVLRQASTELPFTSPLNKGTFQCGGCGSDVYSSSAKFDSGTGWCATLPLALAHSLIHPGRPSFFQALPEAVNETEDKSIPFLPRTEIACKTCGSHLGHVFNDGPPPTGLRYCMNGVALKFTPAVGSA